MWKKTKKILSISLASIIALSSLTGCGGNNGSDSAKTNSNITITFLNSKGEIQSALEDMAKTYEEATGVKVEIMACGSGESPYTKITSSYNAGTPPTMAMLDTTDIVALGSEKAVDLSNEKWLEECNDILTIDEKVYSFPFCVEGRGIIYNRKAIEDTLGEAFDPSSIQSHDSLKALLEKLREKGMENPVIISKEDWSLGAHQLNYLYESKDGTTDGAQAVIKELTNGTLKLADYNRYEQFLNTLDLLLEYNINKADPLGALYDQDPIYLADGEAALWFNGVWAWPNLVEAGAETTDDYGFLPYVFGNDSTDFMNTQIQAGPSKQVMIDRIKATEEEIQAAKDFLNWIVYEEAGQKAIVEGCALISPFKNNAFTPLDPLGADIKEKMNANLTFPASAITPGDHWSVLGAQMQKYIAKQSSREELASEIETYWTTQK